MVLRLLYDLTQSWNDALDPQWEKSPPSSTEEVLL